MTIQAVLFDFDGTLANTLPLCIYSLQEVFLKFDQRELAVKEAKEWLGNSEKKIIEEHLISNQKLEAIEYYYKVYKNNHSRLVDNNREIDHLLSYLKEEGIKLAIVTGKGRRSLQISLECLHMTTIFDCIVTGDDVVQAEPDPEGITLALSMLDVPASEVIFLGDSNCDIEAGLKANIYTAGVHWLPDGKTTEFKVIPDSAFITVDEFLEFLKLGALHES
ncbi:MULTISPECIES: HAD family hydrolase [Cytobacillus]|uniref:HAD family hydrolase n=1 Tax=Cytobacillus TaxID=2675230 RepID=UPI001CD614C6|nr:HAD family hydrolase [Cytobacillus kochii]MCA1024833.1 HAD family hydrolase [Cytobacillus kochii]MCM3323684.1 HAD family hydrolase [Cytobacillus kochii]MCM3346135.1 HAD family hydrolase [Cytobacillus kochii]MDM5206524.1 HAD family hydrolase [Cytobacillus kochii]